MGNPLRLTKTLYAWVPRLTKILNTNISETGQPNSNFLKIFCLHFCRR